MQHLSPTHKWWVSTAAILAIILTDAGIDLSNEGIEGPTWVKVALAILGSFAVWYVREGNPSPSARETIQAEQRGRV